MRGFLKLLGIVFLILPMTCLAEEEEVMWRWYKLTEENVHYVQSVEDNCEYYEKIDKENFIYTDYIYDTVRPQELEGREIVEEFKTVQFTREYINLLQINNFNIDNMQLLEIEILDKDNNSIPYKFHTRTYLYGERYFLNDNDLSTSVKIYNNSIVSMYFDQTLDIREITLRLTYEPNDNFKGVHFSVYLDQEYNINSFDHYSTNNKKQCNSEYCVFDIKVIEGNMYNDLLNFNTKVYKYRDKLYKCFTESKQYLPGYHEDMPGFIKDESDYIFIKKEKTIDISTIKTLEEYVLNNNKILNNLEFYNDNLSNKVELLSNNHENINNKLKIFNKDQMSVKDNLMKTYNDVSINSSKIIKKEVNNLKLVIGILFVFMILFNLILVRKVKLSRMK